MKAILLLTILTFAFTFNANAQHEHHSEMHKKGSETGMNHDEHFARMIKSYLQLSKSLFSDDLSAAKEAATLLENEIKSVSEHHNSTEESHSESHESVLKATMTASKASDIKTLRAEFIQISNHLVEAAKEHGYEQDLYVQFCPMADNNKGAFWLSSSKDILNPYFGSMMLKCGSVKDVIKAKG